MNGWPINEAVVGEQEDHGKGEEDLSIEEFEPEKLRMERQEKKEFLVRELGMLEFVTKEACVRRSGKEPITTKWVDGWKKQGGQTLVISRLVRRLFGEMKKGSSCHLRGGAAVGSEESVVQDGCVG